MTIQSADVSLVVDVGGTNTRAGFARGGHVLPETVTRYTNTEAGGLSEILSDYLAQRGVSSVHTTCAAAAGFIRNNAVNLTNLDWVVDPDLLRRATGSENGIVFNDLQAQAHGISSVPLDHQHNIFQGASTPLGATKLIVGLGTGFNIAVLHPHPNGDIAQPAEAGQASLTLQSAQDQPILDYLTRTVGYPAVEEILSGKGLGRLYTIFGGFDEGAGAQTAKQAFTAAKEGRNEAKAAIATFCRLLGVELGNLALRTLPYGGIYLVGGMSRAIAGHLTNSPFEEAFLDKGRFRKLMKEFPMTVINDDFAALNGCARYIEDHVGPTRC